MSDEEIRDLLDLGVDDVGADGGAPAQDLWAAGRRQRNRGRAWLGGLGAAAAAAGILGIVWGQGLVGGDTAPEPPADSTTDALPGPVVDADSARGEPFLAVFHRAETEPPEQLSGASVPATLEDLQGTWQGPDGEVFVFDTDQLTATFGGCSVARGTVELTPESRLHRAGLWEGSEDVGECSAEQPVVPWGAALNQEPMLSLDGETLLISGLDGTTEEPRVHVALTLGPVGENGLIWADVPSQTGVTPIELGGDFQLVVSAVDRTSFLSDITAVTLGEMPGIAQAAQEGREILVNPGTCPITMETSLRSDRILLAGAPSPLASCGSRLPPAEPSPAVLEFLRSGPTVGLAGDTLIITGTIPESLLDSSTPPLDDFSATGRPYFERFEPAGAEAAQELSGASVPATLEDLQGTWTGRYEERFSFNGDTFIVDTGPPCHEGGSHPVEITPEGRLLVLDANWWDVMDCSPSEEDRTVWREALWHQPMLSLDGGTLIISGLDGIDGEPRVPVALTLGQVSRTGPSFGPPSLSWADVPARTGVTPIALGLDFALVTPEGSDSPGLTNIYELLLENRTGAAQNAQGDEIEFVGDPGTCPLAMESSLRSDGTLLAGAAEPYSPCATGSDAPLPSAEPPAGVIALLRSGPTVSFDGDTMVITGTIPESLLEPTDPTTDTGTGTGTETPTYRDDIPLVVGTPRVVLMSEGRWEPSGELTPLTAAGAEGRRWFQVDNDRPGPALPGGPGYGLDFDGSAAHVRECSVDVTVPGNLRDGVFVATGEPQWVNDPDPGLDCPVPVYTDEWVQILTSEPRMSTDGEILVIAGGADDVRLEPVGMALQSASTEESNDEPGPQIGLDGLAAGLVEVPVDQAFGEGISDLRDAQPDHTTTLSVTDGIVSVDVGCDEPLRGPAWYSYVGPEDIHWQLTAAVADAPDCEGAAADDAELWRQMLANGIFLFPLEGQWLVDSWADPSLTTEFLP